MGWLTGWSYRKEITVPAAQVGSGGVSDFPCLISVNDADFAVAQTDGDDFTVTLSDGETQLKSGIDYWDGSSVLVMWFKAPSLSSSAATTFYLYYGNSECPTQHDMEDVWDSYVARYGMDDASGGLSDSTANGYDISSVTGTPSYGSTGKIHKSVESDEDGSVFYRSGSGFHTDNDLTVEFWAYHDVAESYCGGVALGGNSALFGSPSNYEWQLQFGSVGAVLRISDGGHRDSPIASYSSGEWAHWVGTYDGSTLRLYKNGTEIESGTSISTTIRTDSKYLHVMGRALVSSRSMDGRMDELRISHIARSSSWILTEYNNQNAPASFMEWGGEEGLPTGGARGLDAGAFGLGRGGRGLSPNGAGL
jgi:hypothetical protein